MGFKGKSISVASYDSGNRLTAWNRAGADENHSQTWDYDDAGNWNLTTKDGDTEGRNHSVSNQITQLDGKAVSHDLKGNLTEYEYDRTDYRVKYDLDNRIVEVKADSETIRYRYDALGRRIISKGDDETILIWWGDSECAEYEHRASQDAIQNDIMGHPTRLNSVIARDTEDRENRVELQWYHKNYLDHVYAVSDDNGNLIEHYRYTAFGEPEIYSATGAKRNISAIGNTVMWNTRRYDADNGLYYYKFRHYAANIGRWLGRDPIEEDGGNNLYMFVYNDSINKFDELGLTGRGKSSNCTKIGQVVLRQSGTVATETNCGGSEDKKVTFAKSVSANITITSYLSINFSVSKSTTLTVKSCKQLAIKIEVTCTCKKTRKYGREIGGKWKYVNRWSCKSPSIVGVDEGCP